MNHTTNATVHIDSLVTNFMLTVLLILTISITVRNENGKSYSYLEYTHFSNAFFVILQTVLVLIFT